MLPCLSPSTWISMWRGWSTNFSMKMRSSPKEEIASARAPSKPSLASLAFQRDAQALAAAAGRRLDHHRIADRVGDLHRLLRVRDQAHMAGHGVDARFGRELLGRDLVAHRLDGVGVGADEDDLLVGKALGEAGVLRQEAEAGVDRLGAGLAHGVDDLVLDQIALRRRRAADVDRPRPPCRPPWSRRRRRR